MDGDITGDDSLTNDDTDDGVDVMFIYLYCAMNVMMDEALANLTCTLTKYGYNDDTGEIVAVTP